MVFEHLAIPARPAAGCLGAFHLLVLGRVTSGPGGDLILRKAREVLDTDFPELADHLALHLPDEKSKCVGQAVAAASLPGL
jgi:hypothetical protein